MIAEAEEYLDFGWSIFPVHGKTPTTAHGVLDATQDHEQATQWFTNGKTGIALAAGAVSSLWVLDLDGKEGRDQIERLQREHEQLPQTLTSRTRNGYHLLWSLPEGVDVRNSAGKVAPGIDVRGTGGYIVLPPSPHPAGGRYEWVQGRGLHDIKPIEAPFWLLKLALADTPRAAEPLPDLIGAGQRNDRLASLAGSMRRRGATSVAIAAALQEENRTRCDPPLPDGEIDKIAESIASYPPAITNGTQATVKSPKIDLIDTDLIAEFGRDKEKPVDVTPTPWPEWNSACMGAGARRGIARGWHVVVGAGTGSGKSLAAANIAATALRAGTSVLILSLEMSESEVLTRLLSVVDGKGIRQLEHGTEFELASWLSAGETLTSLGGNLWINRDTVYALEQIEAAVRAHAANGAGLVVVDYLQLAWAKDADSIYRQVTEVSHTIRRLAVELRITTVGLSQVNRQAAVGGTAPRKEGLMGGSSLENDADQVVILGVPVRTTTGDLIIGANLDKNRHGPSAEWKLLLETATLRMREVLPDEEASYGVA